MARHPARPRTEPALGDGRSAGLPRLSASRLPADRVRCSARGSSRRSATRAARVPVRRSHRPVAVSRAVRGSASALWLVANRSRVRPFLAPGSAIRLATVPRRPVGVDELRLDVGVVRAVELDVPLRPMVLPAGGGLGVVPRLDVGSGVGALEHLRRLRRLGADVTVRRTGIQPLRLRARLRFLRAAPLPALRPRRSDTVERSPALARSSPLARPPRDRARIASPRARSAGSPPR